jgi:predicted secreted protein
MAMNKPMTKALVSCPKSPTDTPLCRRDYLWLLISSCLSLPAISQDGSVQESSLALSLRAKPWSSEGITLDFPPLADTGNAVPLQMHIQAPQGLKLTQIEIILPENPNPVALTLQWPTPQDQVKFQTRLRLAASQSVWVIGKYTDGSQRARSAATIITSTACLDGT